MKKEFKNHKKERIFDKKIQIWKFKFENDNKEKRGKWLKLQAERLKCL